MVGVIQVHNFGNPEVLRYENVSIGKPGKGEVRLRQTAVGLNFLDVYFRKGDFTIDELPFVPGHEGAGVIEEIGEGVTNFQVGQRVAYQLVMGSYAEMRIIPVDRLVPLPDWLGNEDAAALMLKGMTAEYLVRRVYPVKAGDFILIHAVAGGVGSILCQWAKHLGATVIGTVSTVEKAELVKTLGCDFPILYKEEDFVARVKDITNGEGVPVVYDGVGKSTFLKSLDCLKSRGLMVIFGWSSGKVEPFDIHLLNARSLSIANPNLGAYTSNRTELLESANALFDVVGSGAIKVKVNHKYLLKDAAQAHTDLESRKTTGSTLLIP